MIGIMYLCICFEVVKIVVLLELVLLDYDILKYMVSYSMMQYLTFVFKLLKRLAMKFLFFLFSVLVDCIFKKIIINSLSFQTL